MDNVPTGAMVNVPLAGAARLVILTSSQFVPGVPIPVFAMEFTAPTVPALLIFPVLGMLPESARWLVGKQRFEAAAKVVGQLEADTVRRGIQQGAFGDAYRPEMVAVLAIALVDGVGVPLALSDPAGGPIKCISSLARTFVVLMAASFCAVSIFFIPARRLWKETRAG